MVPDLKLLAGGRGEDPESKPGNQELTGFALAAQAGDELAVTRLWESAHGFLTRIALAFGVSPDEVPDLVQETMWAAHQALDRFDPAKGTFQAWSGTILVRLARNRLRGVRRRRRMLEGFTDFFSRRRARHQPDEGQSAVDARLTLERLLAVLTDRQRDVVALYEIVELDSKKVGSILGMSEASVRSIARTAREKLTRAAGRIDRQHRRGS